jgi:hypothetical protein
MAAQAAQQYFSQAGLPVRHLRRLTSLFLLKDFVVKPAFTLT